jgi:hypothetical protein
LGKGLEEQGRLEKQAPRADAGGFVVELKGHMKNQIVADGYQRFLRGQKALSSESLEAKYAKQLAVASPAEKTQLRQQMAEELLRKKSYKPSPQTLW